GDPDLDLHRILSRADEGFDPDVVLQGLKEQLDLPPLPIDGRDRAGGEVHDVGQERERPLLRLVPDRHLPEGGRTSICSHGGRSSESLRRRARHSGWARGAGPRPHTTYWSAGV